MQIHRVLRTVQPSLQRLRWFVIVSLFGPFCVSLSAAPAIASAMETKHVSCTGGDYEIRTVVTGLKKNAGLIVAGLYPNQQEGFLSGKTRLQIVRFAAKAPITRFCLQAPGSGRYAISVYQDVNANTDFDKGIFGIPIEPWGLSNNPPVRFGPPLIEEILFPVNSAGVDVKISLN